MKNILKFKRNIPSKIVIYEKTKEEESIYQHHLNLKTTPEDFSKIFRTTNREDLYQVFFFYFCDWHRANCKDNCLGPQILENCFDTKRTIKDSFQKLYFYVNKPRLIKNA
jgi:hypothetical protein